VSGLAFAWRSFIISWGTVLQYVILPLSLLAVLFDLPALFHAVQAGKRHGEWVPLHWLAAMPLMQTAWVALGCGLSVALIIYTAEEAPEGTAERAPAPHLWASLPFYAAGFFPYFWATALLPMLPPSNAWPTPLERVMALAACAACVLAGRALGLAGRRDRSGRLARILEECRTFEYTENGREKTMKM